MSSHEINPAAQGDRVGLGIFYAIVGIACMSLMDSIAKLLTEGYGIWQLVFFRNFFGLLFVLLMVWQAGAFRRLASGQYLLHAQRCFFSLGASFTFFIALRHLPLG